MHATVTITKKSVRVKLSKAAFRKVHLSSVKAVFDPSNEIIHLVPATRDDPASVAIRKRKFKFPRNVVENQQGLMRTKLQVDAAEGTFRGEASIALIFPDMARETIPEVAPHRLANPPTQLNPEGTPVSLPFPQRVSARIELTDGDQLGYYTGYLDLVTHREL